MGLFALLFIRPILYLLKGLWFVLEFVFMILVVKMILEPCARPVVDRLRVANPYFCKPESMSPDINSLVFRLMKKCPRTKTRWFSWSANQCPLTKNSRFSGFRLSKMSRSWTNSLPIRLAKKMSPTFF